MDNVNFNYINNKPYKLKRILPILEKLDTAKLSYSVQELQSMDVLNDENTEENERILRDASNYINLSNVILENKLYNNRIMGMVEKYIEKRGLSDNIDINLSDLKNKIFTLLDLSFKANKVTKLVCEEAIDGIVRNNLSSTPNERLQKVIGKLKSIYNKKSSETGKRINLEEELSKLKKEIEKNAGYKGWNINISNKLSDEETLKALYNDLFPIWNVENVLYEIKGQLNTQLLRCLIQDNYNEFINWGFEKDKNDNWVFNIDSSQVIERYGFHIKKSDLSYILSGNLIEQVVKESLKYNFKFTEDVKKHNMNRIKEKIDGDKFLIGFKASIVKLLNEVDLTNYTENNYNSILKLYTLGKFLTVGAYTRLSEEFPDLKEQIILLKELVSLQKISQKDLSSIDVKNYKTKYQQDIMEQIEEKLTRTKTIYIQSGSNLDINASIYALRKHMRDKFGILDIKVIKINAGEEISNNGLFIDAGTLEGNKNLNQNYHGGKIINANVSQAQKSACGVLNQFGIYVPHKIVQYADIVITDELILNSRYGVNLIRLLENKQLFEFAEARREDGAYLIELELTDEELEKWGLVEKHKKRNEDIQKAIKEIKENIHVIHTDKEDKYVVVMDHYVNCGAMVSYALGCDYYVSVESEKPEFSDSKEDLYKSNTNIPIATFAVTANTSKGDGKLPDNLLKWCEELRDNGENDVLKMKIVNTKQQRREIKEQKPFVKKTKDMVVFGGLKTPNLFVTLKESFDCDRNIKEVIIDEITDILGAKVISKEKVLEGMKNNMTTWKNERAKIIVEKILFDNIKAKSMAEMVLCDNEITVTDFEQEGSILNRTQKGRDEHDITSN